MKNLLLFLFLFAAVSGFSQQVNTAATGQYVILNFSTTDQVTKVDRPTKITSRNGVTIVDTVFYVSGNSTLDTLSTFTRPVGKKAAILLPRGKSYNGTITVPADSISYSSWGTGEKPKIYGSEIITGWTLHSGSVYKATFATAINQLFLNSSRMTAAREPNTGYHYIDVVNSTTSFTCEELNGAIDYTGAKWFGRTDLYVSPTHTVTASSSTTLTLNSAPFMALKVATEGFILVGKLEFLDEPGEWYSDGTTVYLWTPAGDSPAGYTVRGSTRDYGISATDKKQLAIRDIDILQTKKAAVYFNNTDYSSIENITATDCDEKGITTEAGSNNLTIRNNTISGANHLGISCFSANSVIADNTVRKTGMFESLGLSGMGSWFMGSAIYVEGADNLIRYNVIDSSGYNGIHFYHRRNIIEYNFIRNSNLTKDDGGGIYTSSAGPPGGSIIRFNIIDGSFGTHNGYTQYLYTLGEGIYIDESSDSVTVYNNSITNCTGAGLYQHKGGYHQIYNNITFRVKDGLAVKLRGVGSNIHDNIFYGFSRDISDRQSERMVNFTAVETTPTVNSNTYINHYKSADVFYTFVSPTESTYNLAGWQSATSQDAGSAIDVSTLPAGHTERLFYNESKVARTYYINNALAYDINGTLISTSFTLAPYTSKIVTGLFLDCIQLYADSTEPTVEAFDVPATGSLTIAVSSFTASADATGFIITESSTPPELNLTGWTTTAPATYTALSDGSKNLYAWVRDAAGNNSLGYPETTVLTAVPAELGITDVYATVSTSTARRAMPVTFTETGVIQSVSFYHSGGVGDALVGIYDDDGTGPVNRLAVSNSTTLVNAAAWNTIDLQTPIAVEAGTTVWIAVCASIGGLRYEAGTPGRAQSAYTTFELPVEFLAYSLNSYRYSFYLTYLK